MVEGSEDIWLKSDWISFSSPRRISARKPEARFLKLGCLYAVHRRFSDWTLAPSSSSIATSDRTGPALPWSIFRRFLLLSSWHEFVEMFFEYWRILLLQEVIEELRCTFQQVIGIGEWMLLLSDTVFVLIWVIDSAWSTTTSSCVPAMIGGFTSAVKRLKELERSWRTLSVAR